MEPDAPPDLARLVTKALATAIVGVIVACSSSATDTKTTPPPVVLRQLPDAPAEPPADAPAPLPADPENKDIIARSKVIDVAHCKHVLFGWAELAPAYRDRMDPRAAKRSQPDAGSLAVDTLAKLRANPTSIDTLIKERGEDPGMMKGDSYKVTERSAFIPEFKNFCLRLAENEAGIVKTSFGYHVMLRIAPPPLDPLESSDILARSRRSMFAEVQHILIGWNDSTAARDPRAKTRSKQDADKLTKDVLAKVKAGGDMVKLMKEFSEDPGSKDTGRVFTLTEDEQLVEQFITLGLRLDVGEAGVVKSPFGFHIIKRLAPDPIQSLAILARPATGDKATIKYILLGWEQAHVDDERGKKRTRRQLEALIAEVKSKLAQGVTFEALMKELSEDKDSAPSGASIESSMTGLPSMFKLLGTRLKIDEVGVVKTQFGAFVIKRVE